MRILTLKLIDKLYEAEKWKSINTHTQSFSHFSHKHTQRSVLDTNACIALGWVLSYARTCAVIVMVCCGIYTQKRNFVYRNCNSRLIELRLIELVFGWNGFSTVKKMEMKIKKIKNEISSVIVVVGGGASYAI